MSTILLKKEVRRFLVNPVKPLLLVVLAITLIIPFGCTIDDPGFVITDSNSKIQIVDSDGDIVAIDPATRNLVILDQDHFQIHEGNSFSTWYEQEVSDTGDESIIAFKTSGTTKWVQIIMTVSASSSADAHIIEAPNIVDNTGAPLVVFNRDRNSATTSTIIDTSQNPDVTGQAMFFTEVTQGNVTGGTNIAHVHLQGGAGPKAVGGDSRGTEEWILKQNTLYAFVVESLDMNDNVHLLELDWYEFTNK